MQARLILADGTVFNGQSFGSENAYTGEVVFNTGMTGYQEVLSDPSYCSQIVTMTYPLIGNYGISRDDFESIRPYIYGFVVRSYEDSPSNWRAQWTLGHILKEYQIPGIQGIDTRMLTRKIRYYGVMKGMITSSHESLPALMEQLDAHVLPTNQVSQVSTKQIFSAPGTKERIVVMDFGSKSGIIRDLSKRNCEVIVVPHDTTSEQIRKLVPDGVLLSNGPGDPKDVPHAVRTIQELLGEIPIFGICLGHQLFALACGADTDKLKFGHRGSNHPVKDIESGRCYITSKNKGYKVKEESIIVTPLVVTHINNNDRTIEGLKHQMYPAFSVQYHPEAAPGPFDSSYLFDEFLTMIHDFKQNNPSLPRQVQMLAASRTLPHAHTQSGRV